MSCELHEFAQNLKPESPKNLKPGSPILWNQEAPQKLLKPSREPSTGFLQHSFNPAPNQKFYPKTLLDFSSLNPRGLNRLLVWLRLAAPAPETLDP